MSHSSIHPQRELTGRMVLLLLIAFFGIVISVNVVLIRAAAVTFGGVETESSYKAGLAFKQEASFAQAQDHRNWRVDIFVTHLRSGETEIELVVRDAQGTSRVVRDIQLVRE